MDQPNVVLFRIPKPTNVSFDSPMISDHVFAVRPIIDGKVQETGDIINVKEGSAFTHMSLSHIAFANKQPDGIQHIFDFIVRGGESGDRSEHVIVHEMPHVDLIGVVMGVWKQMNAHVRLH